ncbi:TonB-dependent receptor [Caulobacter flavus]|uniref:TonB-dependent receptor n=1 Tax=Caulobacter flavus TaxID=1679497 RepID=A0A2N5CQH5_9CAUL|nr:TonB-dependent receptor [Caulobacter flavus]AYV48713.1 TonB-dependent receptor [Caulobacter flavus]PLR10245.1 TonB-dependent receptor [Caulobacter flavus]
MKSAFQSRLFLTASTLAVALGAHAAAHAQTAPAPGAEEAVEEVVVTGIRQSLQSAVQVKKNTMEVVDSIRAEDIGKLPDPNVAETLTRIPGVQGYRYGGEGASPVGAGSGLTIRGLSGQTASQVDGRSYFTAGGSEFNIEAAIPGMIAGLDVYKNPSAEHIEGGIGGLVDIKTRRPLDLPKLSGSVAISGRYNDMVKQAQPEYFGLVSHKWDVGDGEMGLLLGANYQKSWNRSDNAPGPGGTNLRRVVRADSAEYVGNSAYNQAYAGRSDVAFLADVANPLALSAADRAGLVNMAGVQINVNEEDIQRTRKGFAGAFQWKVRPGLEVYVDGNYNSYLYHQGYRFLNGADSRYVQGLATTPFSTTEGLANRNTNGGEDAVLAGQRFASGTFLGSSFSSIGGDEHRIYKTWILAGGAKWSPTDDLDLKGDLSYVKADQHQDNRSVTMVPRAGLGWNVTRSIGTPQSLSISGPDLANPANWVLANYANGTNNVYDDAGLAAQFDGKLRIHDGFIKSVKFGTRYYRKKSKFYNYSFSGKNLTTDGLALTASQSNGILASSVQDLVAGSHANWFDGEAGYSGGFLTFSPDALLGDNVRNRFALAGIPAEDSLPEVLLSRRKAVEETLAGYGVVDFAFLSDRIRGNAGVRVVRTNLDAEARVTDTSGGAAVIVPNSQSNSYTDVLPTLNVTGYIQDDLLLRFGFGKGMTRPSVGDINPTVAVNLTSGTGSQGNADLKPLRAYSYDLSLEKYFGATSYVSAAAFYKKVDGFPIGVESCQTVPTSQPYSGVTPNNCPTGQFRITQTQNADPGFAKGVELAAQTFFDYDFLPQALHDFGVQGSYTWVKTELPVLINGQVVKVRQPFQSDRNWSLAGLYENKKVSARLVYTYRSDYVLFGISPNPIDGRYLKGYGLLDASVNLNLRDDLTLSLTASNLTNKAPIRYVGEPGGGYDTDILRQYFMNGRVYGLSLRYKFGG